MALLQYALTTLLDVKTALGYPAPASAHVDDTLLESLINAVTIRFEGYCDRILVKRTAPLVEYVHGNGRREFLLKQWPVGTVSEVAVDSERAFGAETVLDPATYFISENQLGEGIGLERLDCGWERGRKNIKVTYAPGYATVPEDIELAAKQMVAFYKRRFEDKDLGLKTRNKGDENITIDNSLPPLIREILDGYKRTEFLMDDLIPSN